MAAAAGDGLHKADGGGVDAEGPFVEERRDHVAQLRGHIAHVAAIGGEDTEIVGVERVFPVHSPNVAGVQVIRKGRVRRSKLYYLRSRVGKAAKVKEQIR